MPILSTISGASGKGFGITSKKSYNPWTADPYSNYLKLALPMNGYLGMKDYSADIRGNGINRTITVVNSASISTTQNKFYGKSLSLTPYTSLKYLSTPITSDILLTNQDFTIETWVYFDTTSVGYQCIASHSGDTGDAQSGWVLYLESNNTINFISSAGWAYNVGTGVVPTAGTWHHVAVSRSGNNLRFFLNGNQIGGTNTGANTINSPSSQVLRIGNYQWFPGGTRSLSGYLQDFRMYVGVGKYTSNFIPQTSMWNQSSYQPANIQKNPSIWLDASSSSSLITSGSSITQWKDISESGRHHFIPNSNMPVSSDGGVFFNTTPSYLENTTYSKNSNSWTWIGVVNTTGGRSGAETYGRYMAASIAGNDDYADLNGMLVAELGASAVAFYRNSGSMNSASPLPINTRGVWAARVNGSESALWKNTQKFTGSFDGTLNFNRMRIGNNWAAADSQLRGIVYEWIVYDSALSDSELLLLINYLKTKWNVL
jgi:hypothetical protein